MRKMLMILALLSIFSLWIGMAGASNYMYEKASVKGVGYMEREIIASTQPGYEGQKLVARTAGSGNVVTLRTELEVERQLNADGSKMNCTYPNTCGMDYINFTQDAEFEYMPVSYQTGTYDMKWVDKLCVQNYRIGAVLTEMYSHAEHLQKTTEIKTRGYDNSCVENCCTGVLEANINSNVIGVAHIGWISRNPEPDRLLKGRHAEYGRSVDDLTGVFAINKFIQLWGNSTCGAISVDWLPCV